MNMYMWQLVMFSAGVSQLQSVFVVRWSVTLLGVYNINLGMCSLLPCTGYRMNCFCLIVFSEKYKGSEGHIRLNVQE